MTIYVVFGCTGEYSDRSEWCVKAFRNEERAKDLVNNLNTSARILFQKIENGEVDKWDSHYNYGDHIPEDPRGYMDYTGTTYYYATVELE